VVKITVYVNIKSLASRKSAITKMPVEVNYDIKSVRDLIIHIVQLTIGEADEEKIKNARENALRSFDDGLFRIFINDEEVLADSKILLNENDSLTFLRLTMLAGRLW